MREWKVENLKWVVEGELARYCRPGRYDGGDIWDVSIDRVDDWILHLLEHGIKSVICLMDDNHLKCYSDLPDGLLAYYEANGLNVAHVESPNKRRMTNAKKQAALEAFEALPKPVLVHCNKGRTRPGRSVTYIKEAIS